MWLRPPGASRWAVGVAWYSGDNLLWYRALSLSVRPNRRLCRVAVPGRRPPPSHRRRPVAAGRQRHPHLPHRRGPAGAGDGLLDGDRVPVLDRVGPPDRPLTVRSGGPVGPLGVRAAVRAGLPQHVAVGVGGPGQDEQQVGQPVEVARRLGVGALSVGGQQRPDAALGPPGDRAGRVQERGQGSTAGEHERGQRRQLCVGRVAGRLQPLGVGGGDPQRRVLGRLRHRRAEVGPDVEQVVLHAAQQVGHLGRRARPARWPRPGSCWSRRRRRRRPAAGRSWRPGDMSPRCVCPASPVFV